MTIPARYPLPGIPDLAALCQAWPSRYPHLLASTAQAGSGPSHSLLLVAHDPDERLVLGQGGALQLPASLAELPGRKGFLEHLDAWFESQRLTQPAHPELPFIGGWFLYLGYELAAEIEPALDLPEAQLGLPVAVAQRCTSAILIHHEHAGQPARAEIVAEREQDIATILADLERLASQPGPSADIIPAIRLEAEHADRYIEGIAAIREYILDGDVFQVNLSRAWHGEADQPLDPVALFRELGRRNAAPFAGLARIGEHAIISSSPERLVQVRDRQVQTRPIAGTRPRGQDAGGDAALSDELLAHPKERAEHIMLIDLERNDLGRVCRSGTVEVDELMVIESYAHVHHIVSNVRGLLRDDASPGRVIAALFPGGTITGCPKIRCMQIIAELEATGRGPYTGSMGYLGRDGSMDLNILIRTMVQHGKNLNFRTGAGIVADSEAEREVQETRHKARGLLLSLGVTDE